MVLSRLHERKHHMSRLQPERERIERRYRIAGILSLVVATLAAVAVVLQVGFNAPYQLVLVPSGVGLVLAVVALVLMTSVIRELPW